VELNLRGSDFGGPSLKDTALLPLQKTQRVASSAQHACIPHADHRCGTGTSYDRATPPSTRIILTTPKPTRLSQVTTHKRIAITAHSERTTYCQYATVHKVYLKQRAIQFQFVHFKFTGVSVSIWNHSEAMHNEHETCATARHGVTATGRRVGSECEQEN
jgi:hypothetical protein